MLIDIIYDDMNYFWNQDYKELFTGEMTGHLIRRHSGTQIQPDYYRDLLRNP